MPVNLANVNISLQQFQEISSGKYNAGEVTLRSETKLGKVNNHVSRLGKNVVPLSHEEVLAVKNAFVKALRSGGVGRDEIARVRRELGLEPEPGDAVDRTLGERSMRPLTRQQVRQILDRNANTINARPGAPRIRTSDERNLRLSPEARNERETRRNAVNESLDQNRTVSANRDVLLFERLVAGDFEGLFAEDAERMSEMARQKLESIRQRHGDQPPPANNRLRVSWTLPGGQTVELGTGFTTASLARHLEDALFYLSIDRPNRGNGAVPPPPPPPPTNAAWNATLKSALLANHPEPLPRDIAAMAKSLLDDARAKFGPDVIPPDIRLRDIIFGPLSKEFKAAAAAAGDRRLGPDDLRARLRGALDSFGAMTLAGRRLDAEAAARNMGALTIADKRGFITRNPALLEAIARADSPAAVAQALDGARQAVSDMVGLVARIRGIKAECAGRVAEALSRSCNLPQAVLAKLPSVAKFVSFPATFLATQLIAGKEIRCESAQDAEDAFNALIEDFAKRLPAQLARTEALIEKQRLSPVAANALRALVCALDKSDPELLDPEAISDLAGAIRPRLESLAATLGAPNLSVEDGLQAVRDFVDSALASFRTRMPKIDEAAEKINALHAFLLIAFDGKLDAVAPIRAFLARPDVAPGLPHEPLPATLATAIEAVNVQVDPETANRRLLDAIGTTKAPPHQAAALLRAARDAGLTAMPEAEILALFAPDRPAGRMLAEGVRAFPFVVTPELLPGLVKSALAPFAGSIHDGVASPALAATERDFPPDARVRAEKAYRKAGAEPWKADALVAAALRACGGDADVRALVLDNLDGLLVAGNQQLRSEESVRRNVERIAANFAELRQLAANDPELLAQGREMLFALHGKSFPDGLIGRLVQAVREQPTDALHGLSRRSRGSAIHAAVVQFYQNTNRAAAESGAMQEVDGADELTICRNFIVLRMLSALGPADREGLFAALHSQNGVRLLRAYDRMPELSAGMPLSDGMRSALDSMGQTLNRTMVELNHSLCLHGGRQNDPIPVLHGPAPRPETFGATGLVDQILPLARARLAVQTKEAVDDYVKGGGPAAQRLRTAFSDRLGPEPDSPSTTLFNDFQNVIRTMILRPMLISLQRISSVKNGIPSLDPKRTFPIRLGGEEVSTDTIAALDQYAKFVTKGRKTRYDALTPAERNKANFAMLVGSKGTGPLLSASFGILLDPRKNDLKARFEGDVAEQSFDLELDGAGNLRIIYEARQTPTTLVVGGERVPCGAGSEVRHKLEILVNVDEFERFANQDFTKYDDGPARQILTVQKPDDKHTQAYFAIPEPFRLRFTPVPALVADLK